VYRWLKYEERVEIGERWSKPHVSTTSLRGLQMFRDALISKQCCVGLGQPLASGQYQVAGNSNSSTRSGSSSSSSSSSGGGGGGRRRRIVVVIVVVVVVVVGIVVVVVVVVVVVAVVVVVVVKLCARKTPSGRCHKFSSQGQRSRSNMSTINRLIKPSSVNWTNLY